MPEIAGYLFASSFGSCREGVLPTPFPDIDYFSSLIFNIMNLEPDGIHNIAEAIQLALGPVFLLTGIAGMLNVMSGRLSRIIDRGRTLTEGSLSLISSDPDVVKDELILLEKRRHITSRAITMCTVSALLICLVIVHLFLEALLVVPLNWIIGVLFMLSTLALVVGLAFFLREVHVAGKSIRIRLK